MRQEDERRRAYAADVTYVAQAELGFDYLRDHLALEPQALVLREHTGFCVVDEADFILIDEARTPLIISGAPEAAGEKPRIAARLARRLTKGLHYELDEGGDGGVVLTDAGQEAAEDALGVRWGGGKGGFRGRSRSKGGAGPARGTRLTRPCPAAAAAYRLAVHAATPRHLRRCWIWTTPGHNGACTC